MSYLRLAQDKMQRLSETVASALNIEVAIADKNLTRIVGTGSFYPKINENCPEDSLFAKVIENGKSIINLEESKYCMGCSDRNKCAEIGNMAYPIKSNGEVIGVISFASFDFKQTNIMRLKKEEYFNMLKESAEIAEEEINNIKTTNKFKKDIAEIDEIISNINKGIIILNSEDKIIHINRKALISLDLNLSNHKVAQSHINNFIKGIELEEKGNDELIDCWEINGEKVKVIYSINKISMGDSKYSLMISFDIMRDIINMAKTYEDKNKIYFQDIIGNSKPILEAINKSKIAASTDSTIILQGDSGTGKELFAKSIHNESLRKSGPFIAINCGSIPESLIESELFGYEKGAFTGANINGKKGKIELANNGTLFLDEIGDLPLYLQTRLLRVLQERTIDRIGGEKPIDINIRIISATHKDLKKLVEEGKFRLDLYYRLNVIPINLPSLKTREEDMFLCSEYIIRKISKRMNKKEKILSEEIRELFMKYTWPGNIRELENVLEHGICFSTNDYIELKDLPEYFIDEIDGNLNENNRINTNKSLYSIKEDKSLEELKIDFEKTIIEELINQYGDTVEGKKMVAEKLSIGLTTLYRKIGFYEN